MEKPKNQPVVQDIVAPAIQPKPEAPAQPLPATLSQLPTQAPPKAAPVSKAVVKPPKQRRVPVGVIIFALIIAAGLIGLAIYTFNATKNSPDTSSTTQAVNKTDVDKTSQALDEDLAKLNDAEDFNETDLSDQTLGL